jgi:hypothetical protein
VSQAARPVKLLQASKQIRHSEPCADLFHIWSHGGCPQHPSPAELECLNGIGGLGSAFCQGVYEVQADGQHRTGVSATSVALRVARLIERPPGDVVIIVGLGPTVLKLQLVVRSRPRIFLTEDGWRARPCTVSTNQAVQLVTDVLTRTGQIPLPCADNTVHVTRKLNVVARLTDDATETVLLSATRT